MLDRRLTGLFLFAVFAVGCGDSDGGGADAATEAGTDASTSPVDSGTDAAPPVMTTITCGSTTCSSPMPPPLPADAGAALPLPIDPAAFAGMGALPCCTDGDADNPCGVMSSTLFPTAGCIEADMPGVPDPSCPTINATYSLTMPLPLTIPLVLPGCCTAMNQCGLDLSAVTVDLDSFLPGLGTLPLDLGVGCMELTQADMLGSGMVSLNNDAGPAMSIACGGADDGGADDGG